MRLRLPAPSRVPLPALAAAAALLGAAGVHAQCRKPQSYLWPADPATVFELLESRGIDARGLRQMAGCAEIFFRPVPSQAAAQYIPWLGFDNVHIPFSMRGEASPGCSRPGLFCPHRIALGTGDAERVVNAGVIVHELAHAEYDVMCRSRTHRAREARFDRQYRDVLELRELVKRRPGFDKWPWVQAQEMQAYYIEESLHAVLERIESVFLVNRLNVNRIIHSRADREALVVGGREQLVASPEDPTLGSLWRHDVTQVGGRKGSAYFEGEPIDLEIPEAMRRRLFDDVLGFRFPKTGDEIVAVARALDTPWAREQRRLITHARDRRVERLEAAAGGEPGFAGLGEVDGGPATGETGTTEAEAALLARVGGEPGVRPRARAVHAPLTPIALAHFERE